MCYMIPFIYISGQGMALGQEKKNLPTDVYSSSIYNNQNWEATKMSFSQ